MLAFILTARDHLSDTSNVIRIGASTGLVEFGCNKEGELLACGDVVDNKRIVLSRTGREILTPGHRGGTTQGLSIEKRNQDFVAGLRRCHCWFDNGKTYEMVVAIKICRFMEEEFGAC